MGNIQSMPKINLYITKVSNDDLPLCPFIHTIVSFNCPNPQELDPVLLKKTLMERDLHLEIMDIRNSSKFMITVPCGTEKLGITVVKLSKIPNLLNIRVIAVKESSSVPLLAGDQIVGISDCFCEDEDELVYTLKTNMFSQIVVLRDSHVELVEIKSGDLGCEIGLGMLFKPTELDYNMKSYNGTIKRESGEAKKEVENTNDASEEKKPSSNEVNEPRNDSISVGQDKNIEESAQSASIADKFNESCSISACQDEKEDLNEKQLNSAAVSQEEQHATPENPGTPEKESVPELNAPELGKRTASYVYKPPKNFENKNMPLNQRNSKSIYAEAGVPPENQFLKGAGQPKPEKAQLLDKSFATKEDFVKKDGETKLKDSVYDERKEGNSIQELFEDEESKNNEDFEVKIKGNMQDV